MKRGERFFKKFSNDVGAKKERGKGRSVDLIAGRNEKLFHRFYYLSRILQLRYEHVLATLVNDFDISEATVTKIISTNTKKITDIGNRKMTRKQLKKLYPHLNWSDPVAVIGNSVKEREVFVLK